MARTREENTKYMREYMRTYRRECDDIRINRGWNECIEFLFMQGKIDKETADKNKKPVYVRRDKRFKNDTVY